MISTTKSAPHLGSRFVGSVPTTPGLWRRLAIAYSVYRERRALMAMSDAGLKDIGLSRGEAYREASRSVWDLPADR